METVECKVWLMLDEDGDWVVAKHADLLKDMYEEEYCELDGTVQTRLMCVTVKAPPPKPLMVEVNVPDMPNDATVAVV